MIKGIFFLSFFFLSCNKTNPLKFFSSRDDVMPARVISNYYNYPFNDSLYVAGYAAKVFRFAYMVKDPKVITAKLYEQDWYRNKITEMARGIYGQVFRDQPLDNMVLYNYQFSIRLLHHEAPDRPELTWRLYEICQ